MNLKNVTKRNINNDNNNNNNSYNSNNNNDHNGSNRKGKAFKWQLKRLMKMKNTSSLIFETWLWSPCSLVSIIHLSLFCCNCFLFSYYDHYRNHYCFPILTLFIWLYFQYRLLYDILFKYYFTIFQFIFLPFYLFLILSSFLFHFLHLFPFLRFRFLLCFKWVSHHA